MGARRPSAIDLPCPFVRIHPNGRLDQWNETAVRSPHHIARSEICGRQSGVGQYVSPVPPPDEVRGWLLDRIGSLPPAGFVREIGRMTTDLAPAVARLPLGRLAFPRQRGYPIRIMFVETF